jgi:hypothetical protein
LKKDCKTKIENEFKNPMHNTKKLTQTQRVIAFLFYIQDVYCIVAPSIEIVLDSL